MLGGNHHVCRTKNAIETRVISVTNTAKTFPIAPRLDGPPFQRNRGAAWLCCLAPPQRGSSPSDVLVRQRLECEVRRFCLASPYGYFLCLRSVLFLPRRYCVFARSEALQTERTVLSGHRIVRRVQHDEIPMHPRMDVALHGDELRLVVLCVNRKRASRLRLIPFRVHLRQRMDVV